MADSMTPWERAYRSHGAWAKIDHALDVLRGLELAGEDENSQAAGYVARAIRCLELVRGRGEEADPLWVDSDALNEIETGADAAIQVADQFSASNNAAHLKQLSGSCDQVLLAGRRLWPPDARTTTTVLSREVDELRTRVASLVDESREAQASLQQQRQEAVGQWDERIRQVEESVSEAQQGVRTAQAEIDSLVETARQQLEAEEQARTKQAKKDREARTQEFKGAVEEYRNKFNDRLEELAGDFQVRMEKARDDATSVLEDVRRRREEVENEAGAVAVSALGGRLEQTADREDRRAFWWTVAAILIAVLVPVAALISVQVDQDLRVQLAIVAVALVSASGYAARTAGRHRGQAEYYRERENRMKTLLPFTANLDADEAIALKVLAGLDVFVPNEDEARSADGPAPRHYVEALLRDRMKGRLKSHNPE